jgi:GT2 family glycosyltransferase
VSLTATVVVTTRNRREDLKTCLASIAAQTVPSEIIVVDDASDDGTSEMVRREFPSVRLIEHQSMQGYIRGRNEAARAACGDVIISLDDDAVFSSDRIVAETLACFDDPRVAAVAIPYIDVNRDRIVRQSAPDRQAAYVAETFIGTAHALRRMVFLALGGYREELFHQGEESDFSLRLLAAGYVVRLGSGDPIHHFESPRRDFRRMDHYGPRNAILFAWQNVPMPALLAQIPATIAAVLTLTVKPSRLWVRIGGVLDGLAACLRFERAPVPASAYSMWRRLRHAPSPTRLADIAAELARRA